TEQGEPEASAPRVRVEAVPPKGTQAEQENHDDNDHRPDTQLAGPRHAAPLHKKGRHEPVQPERCPSDGKDELYHMHHDSDCHSAWRYATRSSGSGSEEAGARAEPRPPPSSRRGSGLPSRTPVPARVQQHGGVAAPHALVAK